MLDTKYWPFLCWLPLKWSTQHALSSAGPTKKCKDDDTVFRINDHFRGSTFREISLALWGASTSRTIENNNTRAMDFPWKYFPSNGPPLCNTTCHPMNLLHALARTFYDFFSACCRIFGPSRLHEEWKASSNALTTSKTSFSAIKKKIKKYNSNFSPFQGLTYTLRI